MPDLYEENPQEAVKNVDIVTTGTFGAMCSSGVFLNFGHSDPPIKMIRVWLNDVEAYTGIAAVDAYIGAGQISEKEGFEYGGGHVIEDLISGKDISLRAESYGTDCYPRKNIETTITIDDLNQAIMINPRNAQQRHDAATNSSDNILQTYMGTLLPNLRNITFSGTGEINPLTNDPGCETIGLGTKIFLGGAQGYVIGEGTQNNPITGHGNLSVKGNLKEMTEEFIKGATIEGYGTSLFVGVGVPIPILNDEIAKNTAVRNKDIIANIIDYGTHRRDRPIVGKVSYEELLSGYVRVNKKKIKTNPLSSIKVSYKIVERLKEWIEDKEFYLTPYVESIPRDTETRNMKPPKGVLIVGDIMTREVITAAAKTSVRRISEMLIDNHIDQIPIVDKDNILRGIVTSRDITRALAKHERKLSRIMTTAVITSTKDEYLDIVVRRLEKHGIDATPVVDENNKVTGMITASDIMRRRT